MTFMILILYITMGDVQAYDILLSALPYSGLGGAAATCAISEFKFGIICRMFLGNRGDNWYIGSSSCGSRTSWSNHCNHVEKKAQH